MILVYLACMISAPARCEEHRMPAPSVMACVVCGQAEIARVLRPGWRVERIRCEGSGQGGRT